MFFIVGMVFAGIVSLLAIFLMFHLVRKLIAMSEGKIAGVEDHYSRGEA